MKLYWLLIYFVFLKFHNLIFINFQLKKELSNFGEEFFEEIEDLKYNYKQSVQMNVEYEQRIRDLS